MITHAFLLSTIHLPVWTAINVHVAPMKDASVIVVFDPPVTPSSISPVAVTTCAWADPAVNTIRCPSNVGTPSVCADDEPFVKTTMPFATATAASAASVVIVINGGIVAPVNAGLLIVGVVIVGAVSVCS